MNHNVYLPDDLGQRAKDAGINLSSTLRDAITKELAHRDELAKAVDGMVPQSIESTGGDGNAAVLRFTGKQLAADGAGAGVYQTAKGEILLIAEDYYMHFISAEEFGDFVSAENRNNLGRDAEEMLSEAAVELGAPRVIEY